ACDDEDERRQAERVDRRQAERVVDRRADVAVGGREERRRAEHALEPLLPPAPSGHALTLIRAPGARAAGKERPLPGCPPPKGCTPGPTPGHVSPRHRSRGVPRVWRRADPGALSLAPAPGVAETASTRGSRRRWG